MYLVTNDKKYANSLTNIVFWYYDIFERKTFLKAKKEISIKVKSRNKPSRINESYNYALQLEPL